MISLNQQFYAKILFCGQIVGRLWAVFGYFNTFYYLCIKIKNHINSLFSAHLKALQNNKIKLFVFPWRV